MADYSKAQENETTIREELDTLRSYLNNNQHRQFWGFLKKITNSFKTLKPLSNRQELWDSYQSMIDDAKRDREEYQGTIERNALQIQNQLYSLAALKNDKPKAFWSKAKEITMLFKSYKLSKADRERLWNDYQTECDDVRREYDYFKNQSSRTSTTLKSMINNAIHAARGSRSRNELSDAIDKKNGILDIFKNSKLTKDDREYNWKFFLQLSDAISSRREDLQDKDYLDMKNQVHACSDTAHRGDPYDALKEIKAAQIDMKDSYLKKERRQELRDVLNRAWDEAISKIEEKKRDKEQRHRDWRERMKGNISRWENNISNAEDAISRIEANIDKLNSQDIWNDDYQMKVDGWISEDEDKIRDIRNNIRDWEDKTNDARSKLN